MGKGAQRRPPFCAAQTTLPLYRIHPLPASLPHPLQPLLPLFHPSFLFFPFALFVGYNELHHQRKKKQKGGGGRKGEKGEKKKSTDGLLLRAAVLPAPMLCPCVTAAPRPSQRAAALGNTSSHPLIFPTLPSLCWGPNPPPLPAPLSLGRPESLLWILGSSTQRCAKKQSRATSPQTLWDLPVTIPIPTPQCLRPMEGCNPKGMQSAWVQGWETRRNGAKPPEKMPRTNRTGPGHRHRLPAPQWLCPTEGNSRC